MSEPAEIPRVKAPGGAVIPEILQDEVVRRFAEAGVMIFDAVWPAAVISGLHDAYGAVYANYHHDREFADALAVGDKRTMITITVDGPFNDPGLYANPTVFPLISKLLGDDVILGSFVSVTSLPGSLDQEAHLDMPLLFEAERVSPELPSYSLTLVIPLVDMNAMNGTTAFFPGSHRVIADEPPGSEPVAPDVPVGSALLFDARVWHGGTPNRSAAPRPVLYNTYQRSWFRDTVNFLSQSPLVMDPAEWARIPDQHRFLFDWARPPQD
ncbi:MAG: phytanoyl-CoA dioxygenase [Rhodospirillaceae bacterium]|nr:phytanoyl-CoA dioxygenase [Rhodospirillaceae bacterium]MBT3809450.1 phytanoyl-CoA dioxygenase [Rhodospirillaceae bacterium]MBT4773272.1 phytanoyl-CoA dioxygenase [Rhodospirillaceae bacterium]MBT5356937.1 phytanoyl-CoA dioxygenase [Rhodospirillaceae bacterium]MBT5770004.1 phytanoyl-CoA dioxygenase [Rhodospirillaceae bacterium]